MLMCAPSPVLWPGSEPLELQFIPLAADPGRRKLSESLVCRWCLVGDLPAQPASVSNGVARFVVEAPSVSLAGLRAESDELGNRVCRRLTRLPNRYLGQQRRRV